MSRSPFELKLEVVKAGAGAGKTTHLTHRVVNFAKAFHEKNGEWPRLVVTTFTRKATQELRERLITIGIQDEDPRLLEFVSSSSGLMISTLHGVFSNFLRKYGHLCGVDPSFTLLSEGAANRLAKKTMRKVLFERPDVDRLLSRLTLERWTHLAREYDHLGGDGAPPPATTSQFLTATRRLFAQLGTELHSTLTPIPPNPWGTEYLSHVNALASQLTNPDLFPEHARQALSLLGRKPPFRRENPPFDESLHDAMTAQVDRIKKELGRPEFNESQWEDVQGFLRLSSEVFTEFTSQFHEAKRREASYEMSDLENLTLEKLRQEPSLGELFSEDWDFWLIDEYQDTSPIQVDILDRLVGQSPLYVVGDPQQSIYLFRGARSEVFEQIEQRAGDGVSSGEGAISELAVNYRSRPELLNFLNFAFSRFGHQFRPMLPNPNEKSDSSRIVARFLSCPDEGDGVDRFRSIESVAVLQEVRRLLEQGVRFEDICILGRTNRTLTDIEADLVSMGFPVHLHGSGGFWSRREVNDGVCLLRFLLNPKDNENLIGLLRSPWFRVQDGLMMKALRDRPKQYWKELSERLSAETVIIRLQTLLEQAHQDGLLAAFEAGVLESGMLDVSALIDSTGQREASLWKLIDLCREAGRASAKGLMELAQKRDLPDGEEVEGEAVAALEPNRIQMMTVHAAKGLKFRHVVVVGAGQKPRISSREGISSGISVFENSCFSHPIPGIDDELILSPIDRVSLLEMDRREISEHQRLFYVALTRAVDSIAVVWRGKPETDSWINSLEIDLGDGAHTHPEFSYQVETASEEGLRPHQMPLSSKGVRAKFSAMAATSGASSTSVTQMVSRSGQYAAGSVRDVIKRVGAAQRGTELHAHLQRFKEQADLSWDDIDPATKTSIEFVMSLETPPMREIFTHGQAEWGFQWHHQGEIIEGQIDLWATLPSGITWVVDYKSGRSDRPEGALKQVALYAQALRSSGRTGPIWGAIVYLADRKVITELLEK